MNKQLFSIALPPRPTLSEGEYLLAADVGGTKTDLALFGMRNGEMKLIKESVFPSQSFQSLDEMINRFNGEFPLPQRLSIAFAGPVQEGKATATNLGWQIDAGHLSRKLNIREIFLINDLEAKAYGLATLREKDIQTISPGNVKAEGNVGIIAPGTGLGEAGLYWDGYSLYPFATEGGHADFAPRTDFDWELLLYLQEKYGHVSWERLISGPGIENIFHFLREVQGCQESAFLRLKSKNRSLAEAIGIAAGENCPVCLETLRLFTRYLAIEASNLVLKLKSTGGLLIGGGIIPKIWTDDLQKIFLEHFFQVGRLRPLLEAVPVKIILNTKTALRGALAYGTGESEEPIADQAYHPITQQIFSPN